MEICILFIFIDQSNLIDFMLKKQRSLQLILNCFNMELQYVYQKKRTEFGRQCLFVDKGPDLIDNYPSNKDLVAEYILR